MMVAERTTRAVFLASAVLLSLSPTAPTPRSGGPASASDSTLTLRLNVPAFRLDLLRGADVIRSYPVAVGAPRYKTPVGRFTLIRVVWNPWWYPPDAEWARAEKVTPPGPDNPMGKVKLQLRGTYYLHGTPSSSSIGSAASHGCIRMLDADAIELARQVQEASLARITVAETDALVRRAGPTRVVELPRPVPLEIVYELAEVREGSLLIHPDVYARQQGGVGGVALHALGRAGIDTLSVDRAVIDALAPRRARTDTIPLTRLLGPLAPANRAASGFSRGSVDVEPTDAGCIAAYGCDVTSGEDPC